MKKNEDIIVQTLLYDFYGELLTEHQRRIYEEVNFNDYTISEVARDEGISRQGVSDMIHRIDDSLRGYEEKLKLVNTFQNTKNIVSQIHKLTESYKKDHDDAHIDKIAELSQEILKL